MNQDGSNGLSSRKPYAQYAAWALANPGATMEDMRAAFPHIAASTITTQFRLTCLYIADPERSARQKRSVTLGGLGEARAVAMLEAQGWTVDHVNERKRNVPVLDLVARKDGRVIEVQVKASASSCAPLSQKNALPHLWFIVIDYRKGEPRDYVLPGTALVEPIYYRSPCGKAGRIRLKELAAFEDKGISLA
jgi:hypothetical protein